MDEIMSDEEIAREAANDIALLEDTISFSAVAHRRILAAIRKSQKERARQVAMELEPYLVKRNPFTGAKQ